MFHHLGFESPDVHFILYGIQFFSLSLNTRKNSPHISSAFPPSKSSQLTFVKLFRNASKFAFLKSGTVLVLSAILFSRLMLNLIILWSLFPMGLEISIFCSKFT